MTGPAENAPSPAELWEQAGGNRDEYARLLREHGYDVAGGEWPDCAQRPA